MGPDTHSSLRSARIRMNADQFETAGGKDKTVYLSHKVAVCTCGYDHGVGYPEKRDTEKEGDKKNSHRENCQSWV